MKKALRPATLFSLVLFTASWLCVPAAGGKVGFAVRGQVVEETPGGAVISGASVRLFSPDRMWETKADSAGRFQFLAMPPGSYDLVVDALAHKREVIRALAVADKDVEGIHITLPIHQKKVRSQGGACVVVADAIFDPTGGVSYYTRIREFNLTGAITYNPPVAPVPNANISISAAGSKERKVATTDERGEFRFADVEPGEYRLSVDGYFGSVSFWVTRQNETRIVLPVSNQSECE